ncbi:MAG: peptide chain release factor N(5)-glutamine methyltransferase [Candidatus Moranbacteria bacterium]|nr:peptide chain release factor N(5)-glutamine methyltransferase [Candidatus Moranbacteria bacterium]
MSTTIKDILTSQSSAIDSLDRELIVAHAIQRPREFVLTYPEHPLTEEQCALTESLLKRRARHEPLAYLLGHREFFGLDFDVTPDTLIPRPETELMIEEIVKRESGIKMQESNDTKTCIVDVGTGSGCIIITLAKELLKNTPDIIPPLFFGVDISPEAIMVAQENARVYGLENTVLFSPSDLLENISEQLLDPSIGSLIITANLPYLSREIYEASMPDVRNFEPLSALVSNEEGLQHYRRLLKQIRSILSVKKMRTQLFFEISPEQKDGIEKLIGNYFPQASPRTLRDLSGKYRLTIVNI